MSATAFRPIRPTVHPTRSGGSLPSRHTSIGATLFELVYSIDDQQRFPTKNILSCSDSGKQAVMRQQQSRLFLKLL